METAYKKYKSQVVRKRIFFFVTAVLLVFFAIVGISFGAADLDPERIFAIFYNEGDELTWQIIWNIRLPRVLSAILAGMALSVAGAAMQSILRNPLGSPFTLGISNAAAFGAAVAVVIFGAGTMHSSISNAVLINNPYLITICAFLSSMAATMVILIVARIRGASPETMILTGIMTGSLFMAGTTALQFFADDIEIAAIVFWSFGDLGRAGWREFWVMVAVVIPSLIFFIYNRWNYNSLDAGDETAQSLGVNVQRVRIFGMLVATLSTAIAVSFFGIIAFVGLVVPHIVRFVIGPDERYLIPSAALFGGLFLLISDTIARTIISPIVLPVGILTSFIGAPLFLILLVRRKRRAQW
ncbi:MAG: iron ABC transporter permease [Bacteroidetes bacterium 4484_276]|nr:MAG: iron ABC transporter permease [Bacteroidetes bacterium 4484_276]OYT14354.1 MAG: iron ABC transporter permease [Bacteroidetes bacterium 4572_114]